MMKLAPELRLPAGLEMNTTRRGDFLRHAHSSRRIQGDRRLESLTRIAFDALSDAPLE